MSTLDALLSWKNNQDQMAAQRGAAISNAAQLFTQAKQQSTQNQLEQLKIRAGLAQSALQLNPDGSISYNGNLLNPYQQNMAKLQALTAAKQTGLPDVFNSVRNSVMGPSTTQGQPQPSAPNTTPQTYPALTAQVNQMLVAGQPSPNVTAPTGVPNLNQFLTLGRTSTTDPVTGVTSTSENQVNPTTQSVQSLAANQATQVGLANNEAAQAQAQLDASKNALATMSSLHNDLVAGGAAGYNGAEFKYSNANVPLGIGNKLMSPELQQKAATLKTMSQKYGESGIQPDTATFGSGGAKRIGNLVNSSSNDLGNLNSTPAQFAGTVTGELTSAAQKAIGLQRYGNYLKSQNINLNSQSDQQILDGIKSQVGSITPKEQTQIDSMVSSTLNPPPKGTQRFKVNGIDYNVPSDKVNYFTKKMGL